MDRITKRNFNFDSNYVKSDLQAWSIAEALKRLQEYENKEEDGLLKILPCPIGTIVHEPYRFLNEDAWEIDHHYLKLEDLDRIGKTVFVDENDAKAFIKEKEEQSN